MPIKIDKEVEAEVKSMKLNSLMRRYIELNFDKVAHEASGLTDAVNQLQKEMNKIEKAYEAIEAVQ